MDDNENFGKGLDWIENSSMTDEELPTLLRSKTNDESATVDDRKPAAKPDYKAKAEAQVSSLAVPPLPTLPQLSPLLCVEINTNVGVAYSIESNVAKKSKSAWMLDYLKVAKDTKSTADWGGSKENMPENAMALGSSTFDSRIASMIRCFVGTCSEGATADGLCFNHNSQLKGCLNDVELSALLNDRKERQIVALHDRNAEKGDDCFMMRVYGIISDPEFPWCGFLPNGKDGFYVLPAEKGNESNFTILAGLCDVKKHGESSAARKLQYLLEQKFDFDVDNKCKQANGTLPKGWDGSKGVVFHRNRSFNKNETPYLSTSNLDKQYQANNRLKRKAEKEGKPIAKKKGWQGCTAEGCSSTGQVTRGRCKEHRTLTSHPPCLADGCETWQGLRGGLCRKHGPKCSADGCENQIQIGGMCIKHGPKCSVDGCENARKKGGMCTKHYKASMA